MSTDATDRTDGEEIAAEVDEAIVPEVGTSAGLRPAGRGRARAKNPTRARAKPETKTHAEADANAPCSDADSGADDLSDAETEAKGDRPIGVKNDREAQLIEQAIALFSNGGYGETSLQEIADKLGITRPLFYYYFKSKDDLLWRLIGHVGDALRDGARPIAASDADPVDKLRMLLEAHATALLENRDTFRIYFAERHLLEGKRHRTLKRGEDEYFGLIAQVIAQGQRTSEFRKANRRVLAHLATGQINSLLTWFEQGGMMSADDLAELAAAVAVQGLLAPSAVK